MRITTWNVDKGLRANQVPILVELEPDIVALQEVAQSHMPRVEDVLSRLGLVHIVHTLYDERRYDFGLVMAARWPLERLTLTNLVLPFRERALGGLIQSPSRPLEVVTVHVPAATSSPTPAVKIDTLKGLAAYYRLPEINARILCGDFNTPMEEHADGTTIFFGRPDQARVEASFHEAVTREALRDAFRTLRGFGVPAVSWLNKARRDTSTPRRFDHVFVSPGITPSEAEYGNAERIWHTRPSISDHLPLTVELNLSEHIGHSK